MDIVDWCVVWFSKYILKYKLKPTVMQVAITNKSIELWLINHILNEMQLTSDDHYKFTQEINFVNDLGLDSLDLVEVLMAAETRYDIIIPNEAAVQVRTLGDAVKLIWNITKNGHKKGAN